MKNIPTRLIVTSVAVLLLMGLVLSAYVGPKLISGVVVGYGGEGANRYSTDGFNTGLEYAPNMFHPESYEAYTQWKPATPFRDGKNMQAPPAGTVPRDNGYIHEDFQPYHYPNTQEAYDLATENLKSPVVEALAAIDSLKRKDAAKGILAKGKKVYTIHCQICHGEQGDGQGTIVKNNVYPTPGDYKTKENLTDGKMFHSITYGRNLMGSHASQVTPEERWAVIYYIRNSFLK